MAVKKTIFLFLILILNVASVLAQPGCPPPGCNVDDVVPIDDHLWLVLVLGIGLGLYFLLTKKSSSGK